jgi:hypothetical protein
MASCLRSRAPSATSKQRSTRTPHASPVNCLRSTTAPGRAGSLRSGFWGQRIARSRGSVARRAGFEQLTTVAEPLAPLGYDFLKFLVACVLITPLCKRLSVSPILGFLASGVLLRQFKCDSASRCAKSASSSGRTLQHTVHYYLPCLGP